MKRAVNALNYARVVPNAFNLASGSVETHAVTASVIVIVIVIATVVDVIVIFDFRV